MESTQEIMQAESVPQKEKLQTTIAAASALARPVCQCGASKQPKQTFCHRCWVRLSPEMKSALYLRIGREYEEAWKAALDYLQRECTGREL